MRTNELGLGLLLFLPAAVCGQPLIAQHGIVNAGSYVPFGLPGGGIARGAVFSIFGSGLGPPSSPALAFPLSTTLGGVSIKVSNADGSVSVEAIPLYVSPSQINAILPSNTPVGPAAVVVSYNGARGSPSPIQVVTSAFGIYAISSAGYGPGVLQNYNSALDQPVNSLRISARPGQVITLWGTGLGAVSFADNVAPTPGSLPTPVEVFVGGKPAAVQYSGRSPCCSGTDQLVFTIPDDAPTGCWVPVQVRTEGTTVSNTVTIAVGTGGTACNEASNPFAMRFANGGKLGWVDLRRFALHSQPIQLNVDTTVDYSAVLFRNEPGGAFAFHAVYSLPPAGSCTTYAGAGDLLWKEALPGTGFTSSLNGGASVNVGSRRTAALSAPTLTYTHLGDYQTGITAVLKSSLILNTGTIQVQGAGGPEVGTFVAPAPVPAPLTWTNRDQLPKAVDRKQPLTVTFSGVPSGHTVLVTGGYFSPSINATGMFVCVAAPGATSFTVPAYILAGVPSRRTRDHRNGVLMVGSTPLANPTTFTASGLDYGAIFTTNLLGKDVIFQ